MASRLGMSTIQRMAKAQEILGYEFQNTDLLRESLDITRVKGQGYDFHAKNKRLAAVGDTMIDAAFVARWYGKPSLEPNDWVAIKAATFNNLYFTKVAYRKGIAMCTIPTQMVAVPGGPGLNNATIRKLSDTVEALLGAIYLDATERGLQNPVQHVEKAAVQLGLVHRLIMLPSELRWALGPIKTSRKLPPRLFTGHHFALARLLHEMDFKEQQPRLQAPEKVLVVQQPPDKAHIKQVRAGAPPATPKSPKKKASWSPWAALNTRMFILSRRTQLVFPLIRASAYLRKGYKAATSRYRWRKLLYGDPAVQRKLRKALRAQSLQGSGEKAITPASPPDVQKPSEEDKSSLETTTPREDQEMFILGQQESADKSGSGGGFSPEVAPEAAPVDPVKLTRKQRKNLRKLEAELRQREAAKLLKQVDAAPSSSQEPAEEVVAAETAAAGDTGTTTAPDTTSAEEGLSPSDDTTPEAKEATNKPPTASSKPSATSKAARKIRLQLAKQAAKAQKAQRQALKAEKKAQEKAAKAARKAEKAARKAALKAAREKVKEKAQVEPESWLQDAEKRVENLKSANE